MQVVRGTGMCRRATEKEKAAKRRIKSADRVAFFLGTFFLATQEKVPRPAGRKELETNSGDFQGEVTVPISPKTTDGLVNNSAKKQH